MGGDTGGDGARHRRRGAAHPAVLTPPTGLPATAPHPLPSPPLPPPPGRRPVGPGAPPPAVARPVLDPCACHHARAAHEHWRSGTDCGVCGPHGCPRSRREGGALRRFLRRAHLVP